MLGLGQRLHGIEPGEGPACRCDRALGQVEDPPERLERPHELQEQAVEEHELPDREVARDRRPAAEDEHGRDGHVGEEEQPRQVARLDGRFAQSTRTHALGALGKRSRTSASRPNACTISMPTTDSSAASVRSALRCWTTRESGVTSRAKRHVSSAISGIATARESTRRTFTLRSTMRRRRSSSRSSRPAPRPSR